MIEQTSLHNIPEYTVSEISAALKRTVEDTFDRVRVRGEISNCTPAGSGHLYMRLKDANAVMDAVCWRGIARSLSIVPEVGLEIIATGRLTTYAARSNYQIIIDSIELAGEGALLKLLEERRRKLAAEGLFDEERKQPIPFLSDVIGVITSPSGAVIRDILHRLRERFPRRVLIWPVLVQGDGAAEQVAAAIEGFNKLPQDGPLPRPDLLIVARGGGSIEDLWVFNEEIVVRSAADSGIPLISAIGHETDTTLIDFSADVRAPTPTAAAEIAVPVRSSLYELVQGKQIRLSRAGHRLFREHRVYLEGLQRGLRSPRDVLQFAAQRLDDTVERLSRDWHQLWDNARRHSQDVYRRFDFRHVERLASEAQEVLRRLTQGLIRESTRRFGKQHERLQGLGRLLSSLSYHSVLDRGFSVVRSEGVVVSRAKSVGSAMLLDIEFSDGHVGAVADGSTGAAKSTKPIASSLKSGKDDKQGRLL